MFVSNHQRLDTGPAPSRGFQAQPSLLQGVGLIWTEMCLHLPSSTHSGDKHSSIPERPHLRQRQGTDRAVHLANKAIAGVGGGAGGGGTPGSRAAGWRGGEGG